MEQVQFVPPSEEAATAPHTHTHMTQAKTLEKAEEEEKVEEWTAENKNSAAVGIKTMDKDSNQTRLLLQECKVKEGKKIFFRKL